MADTITTDLGPVTAYADAVAHGYTGTREDFGELLAGAGQNLQAAVTAKEAAETAKAAAENAAGQAGASAKSANKSAGTASNAAENAADSAKAAGNAKTAAETAQGAAATSQDAAAKSAEAAKKSADDAKAVQDSLPADYTKLSSDVDALNTKMEQAYPDNTSVGDATWGAKQIIDTLCPPLEETGNPVQCYPVAGYPLGCKVSWEPVQEGSGDPSPDNVRAIKGRESVTVTRCGENLVDLPDFVSAQTSKVLLSYNKASALIMSKYNVLTFCATIDNAEADSLFGVRISYTDSTTEYLWLAYNGTTFAYKNSSINKKIKFFSWVHNSDRTITIKNAMIVSGTIPPLEYIPYTGQIATLTLPETVYGGDVYAVTGEGQKEYELLTLDGTENWQYNNGYKVFYLSDAIYKTSDKNVAPMSNYYHGVVGVSNIANHEIGVSGGIPAWVFFIRHDECEDVSSFKGYLAAKYAAGAPVEVVYKLATPTTITATGAQPIHAIFGVNTIMTDAGTVTVTGRADPIKRITDLEDAVASMTT